MIRDALRSAIVRAMKERDAEARSVYRTALAAIDNAEAVPMADADTEGRTEAPRRALSETEMVDIVLREAHERRAAAKSLVDAQPAAAQRLSREAELLQSLVAEAQI